MPPSSAVFLLHILLEAPLVIQGFWYPQSLPFLGMNNTTLVLAKVWQLSTWLLPWIRAVFSYPAALERIKLGHVPYFALVL